MSFGALSDVTVIDLTRMLAGPFCTQLLADHGATVIKIEPPDGDMTRRLGPFLPDDSIHDYGGYFASINRNKRSVVVDLKTTEGRQIIEQLAVGADLLVENFRAGVMDRLGLSYESLREKNPRLVYGAIRGFGDERTGISPYRTWPAFDVVAQAIGGLMSITGPDAFSPTKVGPGVGDLVPALMLAFGLMAALHRAKTSGRGQFVDVAMVDSILAICERTIYQYSISNVVPGPEGNRHPLVCPFGMIRARDGWIAISAQSAADWQSLCCAIERPDLIGDPRSATADARRDNQAFVYDAIEQYTRACSKQQLTERLGGRIPFGPVYDVRDIHKDPHFVAREMIVDVAHPHSSRGLQIAGVPIRMTETPGGVHTRAPLLGEHTDEVLLQAGFGEHQVDAWRVREIVK